jgi:hypothetical protein
MTVRVLFLSGMVTMGYVTAALFFLRFWRRTMDHLFLAFSLAFFLFATNQALVALSPYSREDQAVFYLLRFSGFAILIAAIIAKNVRQRRPNTDHSTFPTQ